MNWSDRNPTHAPSPYRRERINWRLYLVLGLIAFGLFALAIEVLP